MMRYLRYGIVAIVMIVLSAPQARTQSSLSIVDALPPYLLSAFLLNNGHFSISTAYTGTSKPLIYREDGTGNRPVNYTSHVHVKVDNTVYKMPYEVDETTGAPPADQIQMLGLFRDTVNNRPRINANMIILPSPGDTVGVVFTMEPVKRSSGAFIRLSVTIHNRGVRDHDIGVLMLIDTKIGDNDRAPIATSFGYRTIETEYRQGVGTGTPDYWIALEGTPVGPGLTARGNLIESELITPDLFVLGNWVDDPNRATVGLRLNEWDERLATGFDYSDSSVLLIWDPKKMTIGQRSIRAATEIGIVDSLEIGQGGGSSGGGDVILAGPGIGGGGKGCINVDTVSQIPCSLTPYHPYSPDTLAPLFLVTNTAGRSMDNVTIDVTNPVPGVDIVLAPTPIIPSTLDTMQTGVGSITLALRARLQSQSYAVPIEIRADGMTPPMFDTICVNVPGVMATVTASNVVSPALCPTIADTIGLPVNINGPRCLPLVGFRLLGATSATVRLATTLPYQLNARGTTAVPLEVIAATVGTFPVDVEVHVREYESLRDGDTTWVDHFDTITVTVIGKLAEYSVIGLVDTLDMGEICINDSLFSDELIENIGGCDVTITSLQFSNTAGGRFSTAPTPTIPVTFARTEIIRPRLQFVSSTAGVFVGTLRVESVALPGIRNIPVKARVVTPQYTTIDTLDLDTICTNVDVVRAITISTPVNCPADIDTVVVLTNGSITTSFSGPFTVPPRGSVSLPLTIRRTVDGSFVETITLRSATAGDRTVVVRGMVGTARLLTPALVDAGDVRVGATRTLTATISHQGSLPLTITQLRVLGPSATEYVVRPAGAVTLPVTMAPNSTLDVEIDAAPTDIETRAAQLFITTLRPPCELTAPIDLTMRGIQPLLSTDRPQTDVGVQCVAGTVPVSVGVRNRGNAPLNITGVRTDAPELVVTSTFPIALAAGDSASLEFVLTPSSLGVVAIGVRIDHDGDFAVQADTLVTVQYRGVVCGSIAADTTVGVVGDVSVISVQWFSDPDAPLTLDQVIQLLAARNEGLQFSIAHDGWVIRGRAVTGGVVNEATTTAVFKTDTITIDAPQPQANGSNVLARIEVDLLRGGADRTVLGVDVQQLASGDADVDVLPGQVRSLLCAYDERALIVPGFAIMRLADGSDLVGTGVTQSARLDLYTIDGRWLDGRDVAPTPSGVVYLPLDLKRTDGYLILAVLSMHDRIATTLLRMP